MDTERIWADRTQVKSPSQAPLVPQLSMGGKGGLWDLSEYTV